MNQTSFKGTGLFSTRVAVAMIAGSCFAMPAIAQEDPAPILQWFECRWQDMERRIPDYFMTGYGAVWLPPVSRGYLNPRDANQNSFSAGYDVFDRFDLGAPGRQTAYGTETSFSRLVEEFHLAGAKVYVDMVLNHNAGRQTSLQFQQDGGYPGFWMGPLSGPGGKQPTDNWGDFHNGISSGYYQSENPGGSRYCLIPGDLVALCDINHATNLQYVRQPVVEGNPTNLPSGQYFNRVDLNNRRFYPDASLGTTVVNNPGTRQTNGAAWVGGLGSGIFAPPCDVPARSEPASTLTLGRFNLNDPQAGDAVTENGTGYLLRWTQWMLDVHKVDGFRIDAIKHMPSWFYDTFYDSVVYQRRQAPDGSFVTPYSFGECVEGNDFTFDRFIRMPNGRTTGRNTTGDAFGNRDALDLNGAGFIRNVVGGGGLGSWNGIFGAHLDSTDDGFNNGTIGVNHVFSHDNGSQGNGGSAPAAPTARQQGWFAHAYLAMRPGQKKFYHNARGVNRTGGFWPRHGLLPVFGAEPNILQARPSPLLPISAPNPVVKNLIGLANMTARGEFTPQTDADNTSMDDVFMFERRTNGGANGYSGNVLVATNDSYASGFDQRTIATSFPEGTRLIEYSGNATDATVDPNNDIFDVVTAGANGFVTIRVPRNVAPGTNVEHNRGFVIYAPALPAGTLDIVGATSSLGVDDVSQPSWRRRSNALPVITTNNFTLRLTTTSGDPGFTNDTNEDDNAVFCINKGFQDWNGNGVADVSAFNGVVAGYEQFLTTNIPLASTSNPTGLYEQVINSSNMPEGYNYISVAAFRKRLNWEAPLFREFRQAVYVDRLPPPAQLNAIADQPTGTTQIVAFAKAQDRTASRVHFILNPSPGQLSNPTAAAVSANLGSQDDRFDWSRTLLGAVNGVNTVLMVACEDTGNCSWQTVTFNVGPVGPTCDSIDFNNDTSLFDPVDIDAFLSVYGEGPCIPETATCNDIDFNNDGSVFDPCDIDSFLLQFSEGPCTACGV